MGKSRLAVILHADVVGSTALVQMDEQAAHGRIQGTFRGLADAVATREGTALELRGDALLAEFARPSDAVMAAVRFQDEARQRDSASAEPGPVPVRIGIAMGEVIVADGTVTGAGVVLAQRLEQLAEAGGIAISAAVREAVSGSLPVAYTDLGEQRLKGFDRPQHAFTACALEAPPSVSAAPAPAEAAVRDVLAGVSGPRVAVLPLRNASPDPDQDFFAEGLSEDLTLALSASRSFPVLASSATIVYKGRTVSAGEAGRELGARYVLDGSVRRAGNRMRVAVELVDVESQVQVWSQRYDRSVEDLFEVQDEITTTVVATVEPAIDGEEMRRVLITNAASLGSYELAQRGFWHLMKRTEEDYRASRPLFAGALEGDSGYSRAFAGLSQGKYMAATNLWDPREQALAESLEYGRKALELDERDPRALRFYGGCECALGRLDDGIRTLRRAITVQPSYATAYSALAFGLALNGEFEDAVTAEGTTRRLRPGDRALHKCVLSRAIATYEMGDYECAAKVCEDSLAIADTFWMSHLLQAAALGQLERREKAKEAVTRVRGFLPDLDRARLGQILPFRRAEHLEHLVEGLARAGLALH